MARALTRALTSYPDQEYWPSSSPRAAAGSEGAHDRAAPARRQGRRRRVPSGGRQAVARELHSGRPGGSRTWEPPVLSLRTIGHSACMAKRSRLGTIVSASAHASLCSFSVLAERRRARWPAITEMGQTHVHDHVLAFAFSTARARRRDSGIACNLFPVASTFVPFLCALCGFMHLRNITGKGRMVAQQRTSGLESLRPCVIATE